MDDFVLTQAIRFLAAEDAFAASCVSTSWNAALSGDQDNGDLWKQVCQNSFPLLACQLQNDTEINRRMLTLGMWGGKKPDAPLVKTTYTPTLEKPAALPVKATYTPTLAPSQVFAVMDLYRKATVQGSNKKRKEMVASLVCPIDDEGFINVNLTGEHEDAAKVIVQGPNPYSLAERDSERVKEWEDAGYYFYTPDVFASDTFVGQYGSFADRFDLALRYDLTLFRRDNMKSVRIVEDSMFNDGGDHMISVLANIMDFSATDAGKLARSIGADNVDCWFWFSPLLPAPGSDKEPAWLVNCRQASEERRRYRPDDSDRKALSLIPFFEFELTGFTISIVTLALDDNGDAIVVEDTNEVMTLLEGLCWV